MNMQEKPEWCDVYTWQDLKTLNSIYKKNLVSLDKFEQRELLMLEGRCVNLNERDEYIRRYQQVAQNFNEIHERLMDRMADGCRTVRFYAHGDPNLILQPIEWNLNESGELAIHLDITEVIEKYN